MNYEEFVQKELDRLDHLSSNKAKRDATIRAVALARVDGRPLADVFGRKNTIAKRTYYDEEKPYHHDPDFQAVLSNVEKLYRQRENEIREAAELEERKKRHEERAQLIRQAKTLVAAGLTEIMRKVREAEKAKEDGLPIPDAIGLNAKDMGHFMKLVFAEERYEWDEVPEQKTAVTVDWRQSLPDDITAIEADMAMNQYVEEVVAAELAKLELGIVPHDMDADDD